MQHALFEFLRSVAHIPQIVSCIHPQITKTWVICLTQVIDQGTLVGNYKMVYSGCEGYKDSASALAEKEPL